jgi:hypothetical protein
MQQQNTIKALQILHKAMLLGQILFAAVVLFLKFSGSFTFSLSCLDKTLQVFAVVISFAAFFIGSALFKKKVQQARDSALDVKIKADAYRSASVIQWALLEGASLFCIICFLLAGNYAFLALSAALLFWFALNGPSKIKIMLLLGLNEEEMENF